MANTYDKGFYELKNPNKYVGSNRPYYRSSWEKTVMIKFDTNPSILQWASESLKIPYRNPFTGKYTVYVPDFVVSYIDAKGKHRTEIIEVKPAKETFLEKAKSVQSKAAVALNMHKWAAAKAFADMHGMEFRVMNEENIYNNPARKSR